MVAVLMVAEKPSLAESIAFHLSNGRAVKRQRGLPVFEYPGSFQGQSAFFKVTCTTGHVYGCDFTNQFQDWNKTDPDELFTASTMKKESSGPRVVQHLQHESEGCDILVLWLDNDREGENICFEVMSIVRRNISSPARIWRAKFSAITNEEINHAMRNLGRPNKDVSDSVECRQELDLKVGCAFTRFQTHYFQGKYGDLDSNVISFGPCQTPTLGFCVQRHDEIVNFKPESFWKIVPVANRGGVILQFDWERGRVFDEPIARLLHRDVSASKVAKVTDVVRGFDSRPRPTGLNTVELLKVASRALGIGPAQCMHVAEHLYISGYISYPRTESTAYAASFNLQAALRELLRTPTWAGYVTELLDNGAFTKPKAGKDAGDHPPITPVRAASPADLSGDSWRLYDYIARHFIASVSPDCKFAKTKIVIELGGERFSVSGKIVVEKGFTTVLPSFAMKDEKMPEVSKGDDIHLTDIRFVEGATRAPDYLTEADLISLMEKHGIGTDASIPTHINNICQRNYCQVKLGRTIVPTKLGIVLVRGIARIDPQLVLPEVRSKIEEYVSMIAEGKATLQDVLSYSLGLFQAKFRYFRDKIERMDSLFEASFSKLASTGNYITRCGKCMRYLRFLEARPQRLYCQTCNETLALPQNVAVKQYQNFVCPLDSYEMLICHIDGGKSFPLCPNCYNNPPFEDMTGKKTTMACNECRHPTCMHSFATNYVADCFDERCVGALVFVPRSTGKWKACCNVCNAMLLLPPTSAKMRVINDECEDCGARLFDIHFPPGKSPLAGRQDHIVACAFCSAHLKAHVQEVMGRAGNFGGRGGRGGRGGGRGRGGRGGRGGRKHRD